MDGDRQGSTEVDVGPAKEAADAAALVAELAQYHRELLLYIDSVGRIRGGDGAVATSLGYSMGDQAGTHIAEHIHPDDLARVLEVVEWARSTDPPFLHRLNARARHRDGSWVPFRAEVLSAEPPLHGVIVRTRPLDGDDAEFAQADARFASLADVVPAGILTADARGFVVFSNEAASQLLGQPAEQLHGHGWEQCLSDDGRRELARAAKQVLEGDERERLVVDVDRFGEQRWLHTTLVPLGDAGRRTGWIATFEDVTERQQATAELAHRATHDPLTDLPNRLLLEDRMQQALARLERSSGTLVVLFADLDHFKAVNDTFGHAAGDAVLIEVARRMEEHLRATDTLVRLGGDEFVALCEGLDPAEALELVERLRGAVAVPMPLGESMHEQGMSIGIASCASAGCEVAALLAQADQAMYRDKHARRQRS